MPLRRDTLETLYVQLADALERDIACGIYSAFDRLPSEQELMAKYEVSRVTVRQAIALLHKKGLIDVKPLISASVPYRDAGRAFALAADRSKAMKVLLDFE